MSKTDLELQIEEIKQAQEESMTKLGEKIEVKMSELGNEVEQTIKNIQEIQDSVKEQMNQPTLDEEKVTKLMEANMKKLEEKIAEVKNGKKSNRKGELVGIPGFQVYNKGIIEDGPFAGKNVSDAIFAYNFLETAKKLKAMRNYNSIDIKEPSEYLKGIVKAYTETGSGTGDELVPTDMLARLWMDFFTQSRILSQFDAFDMPTNPFDSPLDFAEATFNKGIENTADSDDDAATRKTTYTATELVNQKTWSYSLDETSIVTMLPALMKNINRGARRRMDEFILNADSTDAAAGNINLDDADPAATQYYLSEGQDGLRHQWLVDNSAMGENAGGAALTLNHITNAFKNMAEYAVDVQNLRIFPGIRTYLKAMLELPEVLTIDKFGKNATIQTGEVAKVLGAPVVPTAASVLTEADGKVSTTANNNTLGQITICHRDMWAIGFVRRLLMEVDVDIKKRQFILVTSFRIALAAFGTRSSATHTAGIRNILI